MTIFRSQVWWLMPVILSTMEAEMGRIEVRSQSRQKVSETPSQQISWTW
jgi:hypothetical protein